MIDYIVSYDVPATSDKDALANLGNNGWKNWIQAGNGTTYKLPNSTVIKQFVDGTTAAVALDDFKKAIGVPKIEKAFLGVSPAGAPFVSDTKWDATNKKWIDA